jgi:predicted transcriptional regulator
VTVMKRAEYLAGSLSRQQPWLEEGISRRTWERRRRKIAVTGAPAKGVPAAEVGSPASKAPRVRLGPADGITPVPVQKRTLLRHDEDALLRRIHAYWDAQGITPSDPEALTKAIPVIVLPERLKRMDPRALRKVYRRARKRLPAGYDRWVVLIQKWDKSYDPRKARDLVDRLVTSVGDRPPGILDHMFDHLGQQICDHLPKKVRRLESECERLKKDKYYIPQFRPPRTDAIKERVYAALADGPKTKKELARMFRKPYGAISSVGLRLRNEGKITTIWCGSEFMWARTSPTAPSFIPARDAIVEALKKGPMTIPALARDIGKGTSTVKCVLHRHLLANGTVIRTKFGVYALAGTEPSYVSRGQAIAAALKKGPMSFQALAREINNPPSSLPQFLEPLLAKGTVIRTKRGIYALPGSAPVYVPTCDAIISALTKKTMKLGPLVQHVNKSTKSTRSRSTIRTVLARLKKQGTVKQDRRWGEASCGACAPCEEERVQRGGRCRSQGLSPFAARDRDAARRALDELFTIAHQYNSSESYLELARCRNGPCSERAIDVAVLR